MMEESFRIFVCSDLHAYDSNAARSASAQPPSSYNVSGLDSQCPVKKLIKYLRDQSITSDVVVCAGDLADKACPNGLSAAWQSLQQMKSQLGAQHLAVTAGNHDLDSRYSYNDYDAKGTLQALEPPFPVGDEQKFNEYWARHIFFLDGNGWRICVLNSAAYHGTQDEHKNGRVSKFTLDYLKKKLDLSSAKPINILVCHHPPHDQSENQQGTGDRIHFGDDLVELLASGHYGQWIVIYGHKHFPKIEYARGGDGAPILVSSASLTASPYPQYGPSGTNQFHILEFNRDAISNWGLVFRVFSYQWSISDGEWKPASYDRGLPKETGIGFHVNTEVGATQIAGLLTGKDDLSWDEVVNQKQELRFVPFESLRPILLSLSNNHNIVTEFADEEYRSKLIRIVRK